MFSQLDKFWSIDNIFQTMDLLIRFFFRQLNILIINLLYLPSFYQKTILKFLMESIKTMNFEKFEFLELALSFANNSNIDLYLNLKYLSI